MFNIGEFNLYPLQGGITNMDGGAMFGVVPRPLWTKKYPCNERNQIPLVCHPILIQNNNHNVIIDTGVGNGKFTEKQKRNYGATYESDIHGSLEQFNLTVDDIDIVIMSHMHFDHACGLTTPDGQSVFKNAVIYTSQIEWNEMRAPNIRSKSTYWEENHKNIEHQVVTFKDEFEVIPGITMKHTGGHSAGHSVIEIESNGEKAVHMADIFPTFAHLNPLWVTAYDDYPMDSINAKERLIQKYIKENYWFLFYHDINHFAVKIDDETRKIKNDIRRDELIEV
ncbi:MULTISPECIES: MBL fold metallo-hydrolase [unclassified Mammaliicoccus]|uniref:YtnP family quorum-quenching lactonase n=1 Tax=unclassified Mammaliicoccus TaxID=2803851 RepID=UPI001EFA6399|nr:MULTISPECIES: MBL fold metallo-hydrolase [unclassified Mammaliicoccus]